MSIPSITLHVKAYRGHDPVKQIQFQEELSAARTLDAYFADNLGPGEKRVFNYDDIVSSVGLPRELVRKLLMGAGGGHNGITLPT